MKQPRPASASVRSLSPNTYPRLGPPFAPEGALGFRARHLRIARVLFLLLGALLPAGSLARADDPGDATPAVVERAAVDVTDIDLDELLAVHVSSPSKKEQSLTDVASAITVLRGEDLERMGVTTFVEALRAVPGVQVARVSAHSWAISARGFNDTLSNKLLVLIDGRSVYSPIHSGVFWDVQDMPISDIDRIEVIRGPGGTLWGANAINGVINVITKHASDTVGGRLRGGGGNEERLLSARYGFAAGGTGNARVYARYVHRDDALSGTDPDRRARDGWFLGRAGFLAEWTPGDSGDRITLGGDYHKSQEKQQAVAPSLTSPTGSDTFPERIHVHGGDLRFRWDREIDQKSSFSLQAYVDDTYRRQAVFKDVIRTADLDFQHRFSPLNGHDVIWGLGYRSTWSELDGGTFPFTIDPPKRRDDLYSAFVQDDVALAGDRFHLIVGSKFEHNDYSGFEYQPSLRLTWKPGERNMFWAAGSRAVRTPSIIDVDGDLTALVIPGPSIPIIFTIFGTDDFRTEHLIAYEAGYRLRASNALSFDLAAFRNHYSHLRSGEVGTAFVDDDPLPVHVVIPVFLRNELRGATAGAELTANLKATHWWLLQGSYALLRTSVTETDIEGRNPHHTVFLRSAMDLPHGIYVDLMGRYVSALPTFGVDAYAEADARLAWRSASRRFEIAIVGQNLVHDSHPEFQSPSQRSELQRSGYLTGTWRF